MTISRLKIEGFRSIRSMDWELHPRINVLIGPNGGGKSNILLFLGMLARMNRIVPKYGKIFQGLQEHIAFLGGVDDVFHFGTKQTDQLAAEICFRPPGSTHTYSFTLKPSLSGGVYFSRESAVSIREGGVVDECDLGSGHVESRLLTVPPGPIGARLSPGFDAAYGAFSQLSELMHFSDMSPDARLRRLQPLEDNSSLHSDGRNLAPVLFRLRQNQPERFALLEQTIARVLPVFDSFLLSPNTQRPDLIEARWKPRGENANFGLHQMSGGSIRFLLLATAVLDARCDTLVIDEPELGLHPAAVGIFAAMIRNVFSDRQVILATQSPQLLSEFQVEHAAVVEHDGTQTILKRPLREELESWLEDYSLGELWQKNLLGGRPQPWSASASS